MKTKTAFIGLIVTGSVLMGTGITYSEYYATESTYDRPTISSQEEKVYPVYTSSGADIMSLINTTDIYYDHPVLGYTNIPEIDSAYYTDRYFEAESDTALGLLNGTR